MSRAGNYPDIKLLFEPNSVAVIGASATPGKIGYSICRNIIEGGYRGKLYPINPKGGEILGKKVYQSIKEVDDQVDVASIALPAKFAFQAVKECSEAGVKFIQVISSGFAEVGETKAEEELTEYANKRGTRILGPNIFGLYSSSVDFNSTFSASTIAKGNVGIVTQSGALGIAMVGKAVLDNIGLSAIVSLGNKADINEADCLEYLISQKETKSILLYIEGIKHGEKFTTALKKATKVKPIIIVKSGCSKRGAMAAASHTGSLVGSDGIFDAIVKQCGALRANTLTEAFDWCKFLSNAPHPKGENSVIITNGGGVGVLATDACEKYGINLFDDQEELKKVFSKAMPAFGSCKNPIDITGGANSKDYDLALEGPTRSKDIHSAMALYCEVATFDAANLAPMIRQTYQKHLSMGKPITYALVGGEIVDETIDQLKREAVPVYQEVEEAVSSLGVLYQYHRYLQREEGEVVDIAIDTETIEKVIDHVQSEKRTFLLADEARKVMKAAGITHPLSAIGESAEQCAEIAEKIGFPVVMKVVSPQILHKSDAGGVVLDVQTKEEVKQAFKKIVDSGHRYNSKAVIEGIEIAEMLKPGVEQIVGAKRDPQFGPVIMCGLGGIYVEIFKDVAFRSALLSKPQAMRMLAEVKSYKILKGARGAAAKDIDKVLETILRIANVIRKIKRIADIEINPLIVYDQDQGVKAVDARILVEHG